MPKQPEPRRLRWSVPQADTSTNQWLDLQHDISRSLQLLIRESIQRDGYIDVVNRPVEQLPRRGRPPQSGSEPDTDEQRSPLADEHTVEHQTSQTSETSQNSAAETRASDRDDAADRRAAAAPEGNPTSAREAGGPSTGSRSPSSGGGPMDMDAIFGNRR
ncbi:hypothetical protein [Streptomyces sp. NPDC052042]|uniref:hypothetical protein n=1 Tax=Streptomyces sp. NPDC052042 TaxID=3365683 RepID=UPI0037D7FC70